MKINIIRDGLIVEIICVQNWPLVVLRKTDGQHTVDSCLETDVQKLELEVLMVCWKFYLKSGVSDIACSENMYCYAHICGRFFMYCYLIFIVFFKNKLASLYVSYIHTRAWDYFISAGLANLMLLISMADCKGFLRFGIHIVFSKLIDWLSSPSLSPWWIIILSARLRAVTIKAVNIATVVPEAFCSKSPYFHPLQSVSVGIRQCVCASLRPNRLCLNVSKRPSDFPTSFTVESKRQLFARTWWHVFSGLNK